MITLPLYLVGFLATSASLALGSKLYQIPSISTGFALARMGKNVKRIDSNTFFITVLFLVIIVMLEYTEIKTWTLYCVYVI